MLCRFSIPLSCESIVLLNAIAVLIVVSQFDFSVGVTAFRGSFEPLERLLLICNSEPEMLFKCNAEPKLHAGDTVFSRAPHASVNLILIVICAVHAYDILCGCVALFRGFLIPVNGFLCVFREESTRIVNPTEPILRLGITGVSFREEYLPVVVL